MRSNVPICLHDACSNRRVPERTGGIHGPASGRERQLLATLIVLRSSDWPHEHA